MAASPFRNRLLSALPADVLALLAPVAIDLPRRLQLESPNRKIAYAYFPESGVVSIVSSSRTGETVEVGIVGREGMTGVALLHEADRTPYSIYMQVEGNGHRVEAARVRDAMTRSQACRRLFFAFAQGALLQVSETAVANARANISARLARWLLMVQDRMGGEDVAITHEFLALMMGARRPGVTEAIHDLSRRGLIVGERGRIVILDREGLEEHAGRYYGIPERELTRLYG